jgi:hypothetical protein
MPFVEHKAWAPFGSHFVGVAVIGGEASERQATVDKFLNSFGLCHDAAKSRTVSASGKYPCSRGKKHNGTTAWLQSAFKLSDSAVVHSSGSK